MKTFLACLILLMAPACFAPPPLNLGPLSTIRRSAAFAPPVGSGTTQLGADTFTRANETPLGGAWITVGTTTGNFNLSGNSLTPASLALDDTFYFTTVTWPNDQYVQAKLTVTGTGGGTGPGVGVRLANNGATTAGYRVCVSKAGSANVVAHKMGGADMTPTATVTWVDGDVLQVRCTGGATTTITAYQNGVLILTVTDSSSPVLSGNGGAAYSSTSTAATVDDFSGGSVP